MNIPLVDLHSQHANIKNDIIDAISQVIDQSAFASGPFVEKFEYEFAAFCQSRNAVAVGSGTEALWLALLAMDVKEGDEVITVPNTFIATTEAISFAGAKPVFVDIDEKTYTMNPELLSNAITDKTKVIIPVHIFGQTCDMNPIMEIAKKNNIKVIEDASQAHGAEYFKQKAGSLADAGCFSFYPGKNLGACGEAGAITTHDTELAEKMRFLRDHGQTKKYVHSLLGWNARMDGIQGAILSVKLQYLNQWNIERRECAQHYNTILSADNVVLPVEAKYAKHIYHVYAVRVKDRDLKLKMLAEKGIRCGIHYPIPIHLQDAYQFLGLKNGSFPVAEQCAKTFLSLPVFPGLKQDQIDFIAKTLMSISSL